MTPPKNYFKKIENLEGMKAIHWSKMPIGGEYYCKIKAKTSITFPDLKLFPSLKGIKRFKKVKWETFYLIPSE